MSTHFSKDLSVLCCCRGMWFITFSKDGHTPHQETESNSLLECEWAFVTVSTSSKWQTQYYLEDSVIKFHVCPFHQNTLARALSYCGRTARALKVPCYEEAQSTWSTDCIEKPWQEMSSWPSDAPVPATSDCNCMKHSKPNCLAGPFPNYWPRETMTNKETAVVVLSH